MARPLPRDAIARHRHPARIRPLRHGLGIAVSLLVVLTAGCRPMPGIGGEPPAGSDGASRPGTIPAGSDGAKAPTPHESAPATGLLRDGATIPLSARTVRDLRHVPLDFAYSERGSFWLLSPQGLWRRTEQSAWEQVAGVQAFGAGPLTTAPLPELVVDAEDRPWILDRRQGQVLGLGDEGLQPVIEGLPPVRGLSVAPDGTVYVVAAEGEPAVYRIRDGQVARLEDESWQRPVMTGIDGDGGLLVVDAGAQAVRRVATGQTLFPVPTGLGALTFGRDRDGAPLLVGGQRAPLVMRVGDKALSFPKMPSKVMPSLSQGSFAWTRVFAREPDSVVVMVRYGDGETIGGEIREGQAPERAAGATYAPSASYTATALRLRPLAESEAAKLGEGYRLTRISGRGLASRGLNQGNAWVYEFIGQQGQPLLAVSIGPLGRVIEQVYPPVEVTATPLPAATLDVDQAWARALQAGMNREVRFDAVLEVDGGQPVWRLSWLSGGQTYRVDAMTGVAALDGSPGRQ